MTTTTLSRRNVLRGMGAVAVLAACGQKSAAAVAGPATDAGPTDASQALADATAGSSTGDAAVGLDAAAVPDAMAADFSAESVEVSADAAAPVDAAAVGNPIVAIAPITSNDTHYITSCCDAPELDGKNWAIAVADRGKSLGKIDLALLQSLQAKTHEHTLECISAGPMHPAISNAIWTGLPLTDVLAAIGVVVPKDDVQVKITAGDGYTTGLPLTDLDKPVWLVWLMNGAPLPLDHGYPARLLVPGRYGMKSPKWLTAIEFIDKPYIGYWEDKGWSDAAVNKANALIRVPEPGVAVQKGLLRVAGTAFAGQDAVVSVDVRIDGGAWQSAVLDYAPGPGIWVLWHLDWQAVAGAHSVQARCTTAAGVTSLEAPGGTPGLDGYDGSMLVTFEVA